MELAEKYRHYLDRQTSPITNVLQTQSDPRSVKKVGIIGGGIAGLYSALLLKHYQPNVSVKILEASNRVGGRVYTHRFSEEENQYFEAGAMRLPCVTWQKPAFDSIDYLNSRLLDFQVNLIPYHYSCPSGNRVYVNGKKQKDGQVMSVDYANQHLRELGFPQEADTTTEARKLLQDVIDPMLEELKENFDSTLKKYDSMTLHYYLSKVKGWNEAKINYVEVMSAQTNEFRNGLIDQVILNSEYTDEVPEWKTIKNGMCRLPEAMTKVFGKENVTLNAPVESLVYKDGVEVGHGHSSHKQIKEKFDAIILALPPSSICMISKKPQWPVELEHGLRSINFLPLYKIGLRFNSRFWEKVSRPSNGGQSNTDLPSRWVVYPSYGIGEKGKGVLFMYSRMTDSNHWLPKSKLEKIKLALQNLQELYPEVDVYSELLVVRKVTRGI